MTAQEREKFYDEKIAPELFRLAKLCEENGLSLVCGVEWAPGDIGRTAFITKEGSEFMRRANLALQSDRGGLVAITVTKKPTSGGPRP